MLCEKMNKRWPSKKMCSGINYTKKGGWMKKSQKNNGKLEKLSLEERG